MNLIRNTEGHVYHCSVCGKEIKKYPLQDASGAIFGSTCIKGGDRFIKKITSFRRCFNRNKKNNPETFQCYLAAYNMTEEEYFFFCFERGCV